MSAESRVCPETARDSLPPPPPPPPLDSRETIDRLEQQYRAAVAARPAEHAPEPPGKLHSIVL